MRRQAPLGPAVALAAATALHALAVVLLSWSAAPRAALPARSGSSAARTASDAPSAGAPDQIDGIALVELEAAVATVPGAADVFGLAGTHPLPGAEADLPGRLPARRGGGTGGATVFTGRWDDADRRAQLWSDALRYLLPRFATGASRQSPEALARAPEPGFDDRTSRGPIARAGQLDPSRSAAGTVGGLAPAIASPAAGDAPSFEPTPERRGGRLRARRSAALMDRGPRATDAARRGPRYANDFDSIAASDEASPAAFDLTLPRAGSAGDGVGVRGKAPGQGLSAFGVALGEGSAALRAELPRGILEASTRARRTNPYFRRMYEEIDRQVTYPRALALSLEQGEVVVRFTLRADGEVLELVLEKSSGYQEFDRQVLRAIAAAAPYGQVPHEVIGARRSIVVRAPYAFRNPWIR